MVKYGCQSACFSRVTRRLQHSGSSTTKVASRLCIKGLAEVAACD
jgi:hypothetical protein